jgi:predicted nucleotidyltransferase component of viral defense system
MSRPSSSLKHLDLETWVHQVSNDPVRHRERQLTHILLFSIGRTMVLRESLLLKGGTLLSAAYQSVRQTGDIDFTVMLPVQPYADKLREVLDKALILAAEDLGYVELRLKVQSIRMRPRITNFETAAHPALEVTIGSALRGTAEERQLNDGTASQVLRIDMSFNEPAINVETLTIGDDGSTILAYGVEDIIAEKLRALLQQPIRKRTRRQDVYDIHWLVTQLKLSDQQCSDILESLRTKAASHDLPVDRTSFDNPEVKSRAQTDWNTMRQEVGDLPDFEPTFAVVKAFYHSLPW